MNDFEELLDAIEIIIDEKMRKNSTQIYSGTCISFVEGNRCQIQMNGKINTISFYGKQPTIGSTYRVFVPNDNMSMAFIIVP